jgi:RNA 3'-terminal phosphate cyclase (ATP)
VRVLVDGAQGEGGGQIVRTALALAAATGREVRVTNVRARRKNPGLAAQHVAAARAVAALCDGRLEGDAVGSSRIDFAPGGRVRHGAYAFDVGTAGSVTLLLQTLLPPLEREPGASTLRARGGTHVRWSPCFEYFRDVFGADAECLEVGFYPAGGGEVVVRVGGVRRDPLAVDDRGSLVAVTGRALAANLPAHVPQRMASRARSLLRAAGIDAAVDACRVRAASPGAAIFLLARYERSRAGFSALGAIGKPSEAVAEEAVAALLRHRDSGAAFDEHLGDQLLVPLAFAISPSHFTVERVTPHLLTNAAVIEAFGVARISMEGNHVRVEPLTTG